MFIQQHLESISRYNTDGFFIRLSNVRLVDKTPPILPYLECKLSHYHGNIGGVVSNNCILVKLQNAANFHAASNA